ncbi:MAG TPA: hypothetical protein QF597_03665, partial [Arenicellales bacterium]|nr:hypothetical protein [Arenicellales bacterium]
MPLVDIQLYNRQTKSLEKETVFEKRVMELAYGTSIGVQICQLLLKKPWFSHLYGWIKRQPGSKTAIHLFVEKYGIDTNEIRQPLE